MPVTLTQLNDAQRQFISDNFEWINSEKDITSPDVASKEIVYGLIDDSRSLVFVPRWNASACVQFLNAVYLAWTWRELKMLISKSGYNWVRDCMGAPESLDDAFEPEFIDDGDFPFFPPELMSEWMPQDIFNRHVKFGDSFLNGMIPELPPEAMADIVAELQARGYQCIRDDKLVQSACDYCG